MEIEKTFIKTCLQCSKPISGRLDKKYCNDYCRNTYNNQTKRTADKQIQEVNSIIRKNRRILKTLCPAGKARVSKEVLDSMEYNYRFFSGIYRSPAPAKLVYFICYDYAFSPLNEEGENMALIVEKEDHFDEFFANPWSA